MIGNNFETGDRVTIFAVGRKVEGDVILASSNGASLMVTFEAVLGGYVGAMPVLRNEDGSYAALTGMPVELEPIPEL